MHMHMYIRPYIHTRNPHKISCKNYSQGTKKIMITCRTSCDIWRNSHHDIQINNKRNRKFQETQIWFLWHPNWKYSRRPRISHRNSCDISTNRYRISQDIFTQFMWHPNKIDIGYPRIFVRNSLTSKLKIYGVSQDIPTQFLRYLAIYK